MGLAGILPAKCHPTIRTHGMSGHRLLGQGAVPTSGMDDVREASAIPLGRGRPSGRVYGAGALSVQAPADIP